MNTATRTRSYSELLERLRVCARDLPGRLEPVGRLDGFPIMRLEAPSTAKPRILIDAGIHGDEPASVLGLIEWLEHDAGGWLDKLGFSIFPCLNPHGFEQDARGGRTMPDMNRQFDDPDAPLPRMLAKSLEAMHYDLAMDLHEDSDFLEFYMYELRRSPPYFAPAMLAAASKSVSLSHGKKVGTRLTEEGLIKLPANERIMRNRRGWPVAFYLFNCCSDHVITTETPGRQPLPTRTGIHRTLLNVACALLTGRKEIR